MRIPEIQTPSLLLRPLVPSDAAAIQTHFNNWNVIKYIGAEVPWPYPQNGAESFLTELLAKVANSETYVWGLTIRQHAAAAEVIGVIEYRLSDDEDDHRGFWLAEPFWGQGYMTEAVIATQDFIFLDVNAQRIVVMNAESNVGSVKIKERCGAVKINRIPGEYHAGDSWQDVWEITREKWLSIREDEGFDRYRL